MDYLRSFFKGAFRSYLPADIISKEKHGFGLPFGEWLLSGEELRVVIHEKIRAIADRGYFNEEFIDTLLRQHSDEHAAYYGNTVWVLAALEMWLQSRDI